MIRVGPRQADISGQRFGRLVVVGIVKRGPRWVYECLCDCGSTVAVRGYLLRSGQARCLGCPSQNLTHGEGQSHRTTAEYRTWCHMISRCENPKVPEYRYYGGRGITVCARWRASYVDFLADMGRKPSPKHSIDRINNDGNYESNNCRWATMKEQNNNRRLPGRRTMSGDDWQTREAGMR